MNCSINRSTWHLLWQIFLQAINLVGSHFIVYLMKSVIKTFTSFFYSLHQNLEKEKLNLKIYSTPTLQNLSLIESIKGRDIQIHCFQFLFTFLSQNFQHDFRIQLHFGKNKRISLLHLISFQFVKQSRSAPFHFISTRHKCG